MTMSFWYKNVLLLLVWLASSSFALADSGLYIGASVGHSNLGVQSPDREDLDFDLEDEDLGYKVFGGFQFTMAAVEVGYVNFGKINNSTSSATVKGLNAFAKLSTEVGPVGLFAKAGGFVWETDVELAEQKYEEDGFDPAIGIGASLSFANLSARVEYEYYDIDNFDKLSMVSAGISFWIF